MAEFMQVCCNLLHSPHLPLADVAYGKDGEAIDRQAAAARSMTG